MADAQACDLGFQLAGDVGDAEGFLAFEQADGAWVQLAGGVGNHDGAVTKQFVVGNRAGPVGQRVLRADDKNEFGALAEWMTAQAAAGRHVAGGSDDQIGAVAGQCIPGPREHFLAEPDAGGGCQFIKAVQ